MRKRSELPHDELPAAKAQNRGPGVLTDVERFATFRGNGVQGDRRVALPLHAPPPLHHLLLLLSATTLADFSGKVIATKDGDTIAVLTNGMRRADAVVGDFCLYSVSSMSVGSDVRCVVDDCLS